MTDLHVVADERTTWRVYEGQAPAPLSEHTNATDAELAARARAMDRGAERVVVHDRYHRTHDLDASPRQRQQRQNEPDTEIQLFAAGLVSTVEGTRNE